MNTLYEYNQIRMVHLELTSKCQAACPMCGRNLCGGRVRANIPLAEITLDDFAQWFPQKFIDQLGTLFMCGNFGDPIIAQDCVPIYAHLRRCNRDISLSLNTNGSARNREFWQDLARLRVTVKFGIDGASAETHMRYRRHTRFEQILANAETFINAGGTAIWDMLVFRHNDHEVEAAQSLAKRLGFQKIVIKSTNRFGGPGWDVEDDSGTVIDQLQPSLRYPPDGGPRIMDEQTLSTCSISCKVANNKSVFVSAIGQVFPCCWLGQLVYDRPGAPDSRYDRPWMQAPISGLLEAVDDIGIGNLDLHNLPLEEIVSRHLPRFAEGWRPGAGRLEKCARVCGELTA